MRCLKVALVFNLLGTLFTHTSYVQALPGMTSSEIVSWSKRNPIIAPLTLTKKYDPGYPDYSSRTTALDGRLDFSIYLDSKRLVATESISYRSNCYLNNLPSCPKDIQFTKADHGNSQMLIREIWGQKLLNDFQNSKLIDTVNSNGTSRWYQGKLYNYETWHYQNNSIVNFAIISKALNQTERIQGFRDCLNKDCY